MTERQLKYILRACPQSIECGKHAIKPNIMREWPLQLPDAIAQNLIKYGKARRHWLRTAETRLGDEDRAIDDLTALGRAIERRLDDGGLTPRLDEFHWRRSFLGLDKAPRAAQNIPGQGRRAAPRHRRRSGFDTRRERGIARISPRERIPDRERDCHEAPHAPGAEKGTAAGVAAAPPPFFFHIEVDGGKGRR